MAGKMARNKGANGEREVIGMLQPIVDKVYGEARRAAPVLRRNQAQRYEGGYDIEGLPWLALEVKRQENAGMLGSWWKQCLKGCRERQLPVLLWRVNYGQWNVRFRPLLVVGSKKIRVTANVDIGTFLVYFEERLRMDLGIQ